MAWITRNWKMQGILTGLAVTLKHILKIGGRSQVTIQYPFERMKVAERFRGLHAINMDRCIGCGFCEKICPNSTITIVGYQGRWYPEFNMGMCMFCGLCVDACPTNALSMTGKYELANYTRQDLIYPPEKLLYREEEGE